MAFSIKNDHADTLLRELTDLTGESLTDAVTRALDERLLRERRIRCQPGTDRLSIAIERFRSLPVLDPRSADEILGYDAIGLPT